jgi:hypothetical protein
MTKLQGISKVLAHCPTRGMRFIKCRMTNFECYARPPGKMTSDQVPKNISTNGQWARFDGGRCGSAVDPGKSKLIQVGAHWDWEWGGVTEANKVNEGEAGRTRRGRNLGLADVAAGYEPALREIAVNSGKSKPIRVGDVAVAGTRERSWLLRARDGSRSGELARWRLIQVNPS